MSENQPDTPKIEPIWSIVANVIEERPYGQGGKETRRGTRKFRGGQKVNLQDMLSMNSRVAIVIGRHHGKHGYISCAVPMAFLTNWRIELTYIPTIIHRIQFGYATPEQYPLTPKRIAEAWIPFDGSEESRQKAQKLAESLDVIAKEEWEKFLEEIKRKRANTQSEYDNTNPNSHDG
ncbi:MAG: hypothetical protein H7175_19060 [Burkholderiales bacterium]|nr:hypothetical protein [Anaerolineae bacterium]